MIVNTVQEEALPNLQKAAVLLIVLGEQASAALLQQLSEEDVQKVSREVAKITAISPEQAETVLEEFHNISTAGDHVARGPGRENPIARIVARRLHPAHSWRRAKLRGGGTCTVA